MLHSLVGIPPVLPIGLPSTPNDISHLLKVKMYREWGLGPGIDGRPATRPPRRGPNGPGHPPRRPPGA